MIDLMVFGPFWHDRRTDITYQCLATTYSTLWHAASSAKTGNIYYAMDSETLPVVMLVCGE